MASGGRHQHRRPKPRRAPGVLRQHGVTGCEGTVPHAAEAPPRAAGGFAQAAALLPGSSNQGCLGIPLGKGAQEP